MKIERVLTTHIGSLPHQSVKEAFLYNSRFDLPCLFSLPILDKSQFMLPDSARVLGIDLEEGTFLRRPVSGKDISPYLEALRKKLKSTDPGFKYQLLGPYSAYHFYGFERSHYPFTKFLEEASSRYEEIIESLKEFGLYLFFFDEPILGQLQKDSSLSEAYLQWFKKISFKLDTELGIHCCGDLNLGCKLIQTLPLHLDWSLFNENDLGKLHELKFLGLPHGSLPVTVNIGKLKNFCKKSLFLTPSCGLSLEKNTEILDIYHNLEVSKGFLLE